MTAGRVLADTLRSNFRIGTRTGRYGKVCGRRVDLHDAMIEAIYNAVQYRGFYGPEKTEILHTAWAADGGVMAGLAHAAYVRLVNPRIVEFNHKRRGRVTGTDHRAINDGYEATCPACGWLSAATPYKVTATAQAAGHVCNPNQSNPVGRQVSA